MARRKITTLPSTSAVSEEVAEGLPDLTPRQLAFVKGILEGLTASDAYRAAYNCEKTQVNSIWALASRAAANIKVRLWLSAARQAHLGAATLTIATHLRELERLREIALDSGNIGAAVQAEQYRGKASGLYVDLVAEVAFDPVHTLNQIAEQSPDLAEALAKAYNIKFALHRTSSPTETRH